MRTHTILINFLRFLSTYSALFIIF